MPAAYYCANCAADGVAYRLSDVPERIDGVFDDFGVVHAIARGIFVLEDLAVGSHKCHALYSSETDGRCAPPFFLLIRRSKAAL